MRIVSTPVKWEKQLFNSCFFVVRLFVNISFISYFPEKFSDNIVNKVQDDLKTELIKKKYSCYPAILFKERGIPFDGTAGINPSCIAAI